MKDSHDDGDPDRCSTDNFVPQTVPPKSADTGASELSQQLQRIHEYSANAYRNVDPLAAVIAFANANLLFAEAHLSDALRKSIASQPLTVENLLERAPAIDKEIRLVKLANQTTQLELQLRKFERANR